MYSYTLAVVVVAVYASAVAGLVMLRRVSRPAEVPSFRVLGEVLKARFPDLPAGFTLREGLERARRAVPSLDWDGINRALVAYEGYRYGGLPDSGGPQPALSDLVSVLRRAGS